MFKIKYELINLDKLFGRCTSENRLNSNRLLQNDVRFNFTFQEMKNMVVIQVLDKANWVEMSLLCDTL